MARILLVTNDFPPTIGGIQSYLRDFVGTLDPADIMVFASTQDAAAAAEHDAQSPYRVVRWAGSMMLPTPAVEKQMRQLIEQHSIEVVWFGAAAPLAVMGKAAKEAGARTVIATTHGHEVGWSMLPGARHALRRIGEYADYITYISDYTLRRLKKAFGGHATWVHMPSAVEAGGYVVASSDAKAAARRALGLDDDALVVVCVSRLVPRKGQDQLIRAMPAVRERFPEAELLIVGRGRYKSTLQALAAMYFPETRFHEAKGDEGLKQVLTAADVFAMPARTRGGGLDVEGLGIVYLEAQAAGLPVVAGDSGGAPETVTPETGIVVPGAATGPLEDALVRLLGDAELRERMGKAGRRHVEENWNWTLMGERLREITN